MKRAIVFLMAAAMVITTAGAALAGSESGDKEIQIQGALSKFTNSENDDSSSTTSVQITFNYFFSPNISIGGTWWGNNSVTEPEDGDKTTTTNNFLLLRGDLYLGSATSKIVPYIGAHAGQSSYTYESTNYDSSGSTSAYGYHGGLKIFATENTSWNLELNTTTYTPEAEDGQKEIDLTNTQFLVGFSYYF